MLRGSSPTTTRGLQPAERSLCWFYGKRERERLGTSEGLRSLVSMGLRFARARFAVRRRIPGGGRAQSRFRDRQMRSQIQESADAQSDPSACMRETHEGPSQILLWVLTHSACRHHPSAAASPRRSVGVGCEDGAQAERRRRPEHHPRAQHPGTSRYKKKSGTGPPQPYQRASAEQPEPQTPRPNPRVSDGREVSAMRIPPTLPPPRAKSALRFGVRRWGIRFRAQRSEHGNGPPAAAGIMSTATSERASERATRRRRGHRGTGDYGRAGDGRRERERGRTAEPVGTMPGTV